MSSVTAEEPAWPIGADHYELEQVIGEGAFAKVWKAKVTAEGPHKGKAVAIKVIAMESFASTIEDIHGEVRTMKLCRHEHVLTLCCSFIVESDLFLVSPFMEKGSCFYVMRYLRGLGVLREGVGFDEDSIAVILRQALEALKYLHANKQVHRDIKAGNILLDTAGNVKLADFGVAGWLDEAGRGKKRETFVGTPCWMAPEVMADSGGYDEKADIWSLGITALELAKGTAPYANMTPMQVLVQTLREPPPSLASYEEIPGLKLSFSSNFNKFVDMCLKKDPTERPDAATLLSAKFVKNAKTTKLAKLLEEVPDVGAATGTLPEKPQGYLAVRLRSGSLPDPASSTTGDAVTGAGASAGAGAGAGADAAGGSATTAATSVPAAAPKYVPGTTWYFPEDEPVKPATDATKAFLSTIDTLGEADSEDDDGMTPTVTPVVPDPKAAALDSLNALIDEPTGDDDEDD